MRLDAVQTITRSGRKASRLSLSLLGNQQKTTNCNVKKNEISKLQKSGHKDKKGGNDNNNIKTKTLSKSNKSNISVDNSVNRGRLRKEINSQYINNNIVSDTDVPNKPEKKVRPKIKTDSLQSIKEITSEIEKKNTLIRSRSRGQDHSQSSSKNVITQNRKHKKRSNKHTNKDSNKLQKEEEKQAENARNIASDNNDDLESQIKEEDNQTSKQRRSKRKQLMKTNDSKLTPTVTSSMKSLKSFQGASVSQEKTQVTKMLPENVRRGRRSSRVMSVTEFQGVSTSTPKKRTNNDEKRTNAKYSNIINTCSNITNVSFNDLLKNNSNFLKPTEKISNIRNSNISNTEKGYVKSQQNNDAPSLNKTVANISKPPIYKTNRNSVQSPQKRILFQNTYKSLRPRKSIKQYKDFVNTESIRIEDEEIENEIKNVPVYNKPMKTHEKQKKDVYEFDVETTSGSQTDSDNEYDKEINGQMQLIKKMEKQHIKTKLKLSKRPRAKKHKHKTNNKQLEHKAVMKNVKDDKKKMSAVPNNPKDMRKITILSNLQFKTNSTCINIPFRNSKDINQDRNEILEIENSFMDLEPIDMPEFEINSNSTSSSRKSKEAYDRFCQPIANSTINQLTSSPWRPNLIYRNGPHILQIKKSSLPAFNQDMVLNSTIVEAHAMHTHVQDKPTKKHVMVSPVRVSKRIKTKQTSILNFMSGNIPKEDEINNTLFDENLLLSPLKQAKPREMPAQISASTNQKRVLRDRTNLMHSITATPPREASDLEFFALPTSGVVPSGKPTRFQLPLPKMAITGVPKDNVIANSSVFESPVTPSKPDESTCNTSIVGLFEDYNDLQTTREGLPSFTYERKRKRVRVVSYVSDNEELKEDYNPDEVKKKHRKKKGEMPQKEKEEMNKWAKDFNKMCEEIDDFTLEVE